MDTSLIAVGVITGANTHRSCSDMSYKAWYCVIVLRTALACWRPVQALMGHWQRSTCCATMATMLS